jgi:hypothetical protein
VSAEHLYQPHTNHQQGLKMTIQLYAFDTPNGRKISVALEEDEPAL